MKNDLIISCLKVPLGIFVGCYGFLCTDKTEYQAPYRYLRILPYWYDASDADTAKEDTADTAKDAE